MISKELISKELMSEVYNTEANIIELVFNETSKLVVYRDNQIKDKLILVNIYELAHKCKEWAIKQHKIDLITLELDKNEKTISCSILYGEIHPNMKMYYFNADTEIEAIFKACQWILDSKKEGN